MCLVFGHSVALVCAVSFRGGVQPHLSLGESEVTRLKQERINKSLTN